MTNLLINFFIKDKDILKPEVRERYGMLSSFTGIACNVILFALKFILGTITGSIAVSTDAFNNLSDCLSCVITLASYKMAAKPADRDHPFGHGRMEYLASLFIGTVIIIVGFEFLKTSIDKTIHPETVSYTPVIIVSLVLSIALKLWMGFFNKKLGSITKSQAMLATAEDSFSDCLTTSVTVVSLIASRFVSFPIDGIMGIVVSLLILKAGIGIMKETVDTLLGKPADKETIEEIMKIVKEYPIVLGVHDMVVHNYGPGNMMASLHAEVDSCGDILETHDNIDLLEHELYEKLHIITTIHMDPIELNNPVVNETRSIIEKILKEIDERITTHDFRMVVGETHSNVIFDVVIPHEYSSKTKELKEKIDDELHKVKPLYMTVITFDTEY